MICVPRSCCAGLFAGPQRCQERWGWRCWWKASQACQNISLKLMNWVLRSWKMKMTNSHKNIINPFLESSTLLIMTFPEIVESKDLLCGRTCAVDNVRARRKGVLGKLYEIQISPERGLRNSLKFPSYFGMEYARPWNMGKKLLETWTLFIITCFSGSITPFANVVSQLLLLN